MEKWRNQIRMARKIEKLDPDLVNYIEGIAMKRMLITYNVYAAITLNSDFKFGKDRINKFIDLVLKQLQASINDESISEIAEKEAQRLGINYKNHEVMK